MNYKQSKEILSEIQKANQILINCHRGPDADSVCSALATMKVLKKLGKHVDVVSPGKLPERVSFLPMTEEIKVQSFEGFDYSKYDLFLTLDSSTFDQATDTHDLPEDIRIIVIDHHLSNDNYGDINLVDAKSSSTCEMLYLLFDDWKIKGLGTDVYYLLMAGIVEDTGAFKFSSTSKKTFEIVCDLMDRGVDKDEIVRNLILSIDLKYFRYWGKVFERLEIDERYGFVYSAVDYKTYKPYENCEGIRQVTATSFFSSFKDSDFGVHIVESEIGKVSVNLRSRSNFDVSKPALELGGGGHAKAAGGQVVNMEFNKAVKHILGVIRKHAKVYSNRNEK